MPGKGEKQVVEQAPNAHTLSTIGQYLAIVGKRCTEDVRSRRNMFACNQIKLVRSEKERSKL